MKYVLNKTNKEIRDAFLSDKTVLIHQVNGSSITPNQPSDPPVVRAVPLVTIVGSESYETLESFAIDYVKVWCYIGGMYYIHFYNSAEEALNSYFVIYDDDEEEEDA